MRIDGKQVAAQMVTELKTRSTPKKYLAALWVEKDSASESFLKQKEKISYELGVEFRLIRHPGTVTTETLSEEIEKIGNDVMCGGVVLQLPLPNHIDRNAVIRAVPKEKDVDALSGSSVVLPPAVGVVQKILEIYSVELSKKIVVIVGAGFLTGAPIAKWIDGRAKALFIVDKGDDFEPLGKADVIISGTGVAGLIRPEMLKAGAVAIDFGYGTSNGRMMGDFDPNCELVCSAFTPTPGGTGPILVAQLFTNFYALCEAHGR